MKKPTDSYVKQLELDEVNFIPNTTINELEIRQAETFDPVTIDRKLGWEKDLGMNIMRVFLHNIPYENDKEGFLKRINEF